MPTLFKPRKEDDFPFVGVYRAVIKRVFVVVLLAVVFNYYLRKRTILRDSNGS